MRRIVLLLMAAALLPLSLFAQAPVGFSYQAAIYQNGSPVANRSVDLMLKLVDAQDQVFYTEECKGVQTDAAGLVNVVIGEKDPAAISQVPWGAGIWISASVNVGGGYVSLGKVKLQAVPYALHACAGMTIRMPENYGDDKPLFQVLDDKGNQLFSVSKNTVMIATQSDNNQEEGTHAGGIRGGFLVGTRTASGDVVNRMQVSEGVEFNVDDGSRGVRGGFAVNSRTIVSNRGNDEKTLELAPRLRIGSGGVNLFVDETKVVDRAGGVRGGFAVHLNRSMTRGASRAITFVESQPLMFLGERESFMTIGKVGALCNGQSSTFSVRNRCDDNKVVMQVTPEGEVQAVQHDALKEVAATTPVKPSYEGRAHGNMNGLARWWVPEIEVLDPATGVKVRLTSGYRIEILDSKLQEYLEVREVKTVGGQYGDEVITCLGLHLLYDAYVKGNVTKYVGRIRVVDEFDPTNKIEGEITLIDTPRELERYINGGGVISFEDSEYQDFVNIQPMIQHIVLNEGGMEALSPQFEPAVGGAQPKLELFPGSYHGRIKLSYPQSSVEQNVTFVDAPNATAAGEKVSNQEYKLGFKDKVTGLSMELTYKFHKYR